MHMYSHMHTYDYTHTYVYYTCIYIYTYIYIYIYVYYNINAGLFRANLGSCAPSSLGQGGTSPSPQQSSPLHAAYLQIQGPKA